MLNFCSTWYNDDGDSMFEKFNLLRKQYSEIIYRNYQISYDEEVMQIKYQFEIPNLITFEPTISIPKKDITNDSINENLLNSIIFRLGLIELISYYKCVCPKKVVIEAGFIDEEEQAWFKKLFFNGLGEFFYVNNIKVREEELFEFEVKGEKIELGSISYLGHGNLIPIGGGKDSIVTLELLKDYDNKCFIINPKQVHLDCVKGNDFYTVKRTIDKNLIELNKQGFLNGHTPFSAIVAFTSYLVAYLTNRKYIVLSNEGSANEATVIGTNINHQYSKTFEFEKDFYSYTKKYFQIDIHYFSLLRPIKEIQIAYLFSHYKKYHKIFRSCNVGSKETPWKWCCNCAKCLFVYIIMEAFMSENEVIHIFGENMMNKKELEPIFLELIGKGDTKPFECIGTVEEVKYAMNRIIKKDSSYLATLYKNNYYEEINLDLTKLYYENHVIEEYLEILKDAIRNAK